MAMWSVEVLLMVTSAGYSPFLIWQAMASSELARQVCTFPNCVPVPFNAGPTNAQMEMTATATSRMINAVVTMSLRARLLCMEISSLLQEGRIVNKDCLTEDIVLSKQWCMFLPNGLAGSRTPLARASVVYIPVMLQGPTISIRRRVLNVFKQLLCALERGKEEL